MGTEGSEIPVLKRAAEARLSPAERMALDFVTQHPGKTASCSLEGFCRMVPVSRAVAYRLCKKLGFQSFQQLKAQVARDWNPHQVTVDVNRPLDRMDSTERIVYQMESLMENAIRQTRQVLSISALEKAAGLLAMARQVDIYAHAHNAAVADGFLDRLHTAGKKAVLARSFYEMRMQALCAGKDHVAVLLSYSGHASWLEPIIRKLEQSGVPCILASMEPAGKCVHLRLPAGEDLQDRQGQYHSHMAMQFAMDVLYACFYNLNPERHERFLKENMDFMDDRI